MASQLSSSNLISDRYASALYDIAAESKCVDDILSDLKLLENCIKNSNQLKLLLKSPLIKSWEKLKIIENILAKKIKNNLTLTFIKVISQNKRFQFLLSIISQFMNINAIKRGNILADVTSANQLSDIQKDEIKNQLKSKLGEKLSLNFKIDKKIIGGLIIKVGSKMIDSSLASKINKLNIAMKGT